MIAPSHAWKPWKFSCQPPEFYNGSAAASESWFLHLSPDLVAPFVEDVVSSAGLDVSKRDDWYKLTTKNVTDVGGPSVLLHVGSIANLVRLATPSYIWYDWLFTDQRNPSKAFWERQETIQVYFAWVSTQLKLDEEMGLDAWYDVSGARLKALAGGKSLLNRSGRFAGSFPAALGAAFPHHTFLPWKFRRASNSFWSEHSNHRQYFEWLRQRLGWLNPEDWYDVSKWTLLENDGGGLLAHYYNNSPIAFVKTMFPSHTWVDWKFAHVPIGFWSSQATRKALFDWIFHDMGFKTMDDWYKVRKEDIVSRHGAGLLMHRYGNCFPLALASIYPDHEWQSWRWPKMPPLYWSSSRDDAASAAGLVERAASSLGVSRLEDWYRVSKPQLKQAGILGIVSVYGGIYPLLQRVYPSHTWEAAKFEMINKRSQQRHLVNVIQGLFPQAELLEEQVLVTQRSSNRSPSASAVNSVQLDVWIRHSNLAFEYQGEHHYTDVTGVGVSRKKVSTDLSKAVLCMKEGITLISVPYWWDGSAETISNEIHQVRPDLIPAPMADGRGFPMLRNLTGRASRQSPDHKNAPLLE